MIEMFNRILYFICAVCVIVTMALLLIAIWAEIDDEMMWKTVGSGFVLILASGIMLAINSQILKMKQRINTKEQERPNL